MRPIREVLTCPHSPLGEAYHTFRFPRHSREVYREIIFSLDYRLQVYQDVLNPSDPNHGDIFVLFSRRNGRQWGFLAVKRGCGTGCDHFLSAEMSTWKELDATRDRLITEIKWHNGERLLDWLHSSDGREDLRDQGVGVARLSSFIESVDRAMI
jgi:hypothetical protein